PFKPGLSATVQIFTKHDRGLVVPIQSVTVRSDDKDSTNTNKQIQEYVFILSGEAVKQVPIKTGIQDDKNIIILSGLKKGDQVVTRPFDANSKNLKDGSKVEKVDKSVL